jgi:hypothetical protein
LEKTTRSAARNAASTSPATSLSSPEKTTSHWLNAAGSHAVTTVSATAAGMRVGCFHFAASA